MNLDPAELSAFLDGELDAPRAAQVEAIIAADPSVRAEYESLKQTDARWRSIARGAAFRPRVTWPTRAKPYIPRWPIAPLVFIPLASVAGKLTGAMATSFALNSLSLLVLIVCLLAASSSENRTEDYPQPRSLA